ncbi:hypothetical protein ACIPSE_21975 [Streptomyces sp. NPDC090106]|uniref:hypothetical protein n=1 Tax=Streptomyces sp. NPDC090106 TaxID=3365946 RepID=UPI0037F48BAA
MSFGGPGNPYQPQWPPNGGPYPPQQPPPPGNGPYVPPQPNPYPDPYPNPYPYVPPQPRPAGLFATFRHGEWPPLRVLLRGGRDRIAPTTWALLLLPCFWMVVYPLMITYVFARSARSRAHRVFPPRLRRRYDDPAVVRIQKARAWSALAMSGLLLAVYGKPEDIGQAQEQFTMRLFVTPVLLLLSTPVVIWLLYRWASSDLRTHMRRHVRAAVRSTLWFLGAVAAVGLTGWGAIAFGQDPAAPTPESAADLPWLSLAFIAPFLWLLCFLAFAVGPAVRTGFNTAEVHGALPALLTCVLVWEFALLSLPLGMPPGPPAVSVLAFLGGPLSVTAVAWWEMRRLRDRFGVRLRG